MTDSVTLALSELRSLITKAARGAGLSWGVAEEAGWAADWLARRGMPAADWAADWLAARMGGALSPVEVGVELADKYSEEFALERIALPDGLTAPAYLLPFLHQIAKAVGHVTIAARVGQVASISSAGDVTIGPAWQAQSDGWILNSVKGLEAQTRLPVRPLVSNSVIECLEGLSLRTTVPPSEISRKDAGAHEGDSD